MLYTRWFRNVFAGLALAALATPACGSDTKKAEQKADPLGSASGFCAAWGEAACGQTVVDRCAAASAEDCAASQAQVCLRLIKASAYDPANAERCLQGVENAYKDAILSAEEYQIVRELAAPCDELFAGTTSEGGACNEDSDCDTLTGVRCVIKPGDSDGECHVPVELSGGEDCEAAAAVCIEGFYCNDGNCDRQEGVGDECSADAACASGRCSDADGDPETPATCEPKLPQGSQCATSQECESGLCAGASGAGRCAPEVVLTVADPLCDDLR